MAPGAVPRSVASRLRQTISVQDFGAVPDGKIDATAAIQAAVDLRWNQHQRRWNQHQTEQSSEAAMYQQRQDATARRSPRQSFHAKFFFYVLHRYG